LAGRIEQPERARGRGVHCGTCMPQSLRNPARLCDVETLLGFA